MTEPTSEIEEVVADLEATEKKEPAIKLTPEIREKMKRRLTKEEYAEAKRRYEEDGDTLAMISGDLGISVTALHGRFKKDKVVKNAKKKAIEEEIEARRKKAYADSAQEVITSGQMMAEMAMKGIMLIQKETMKGVMTPIRDSKQQSTQKENHRSLNLAIDTLTKCRALAMNIVNEFKDSDDSQLPELTIREMTQQDLDDLKREAAEAEELMGGELPSLDPNEDEDDEGYDEIEIIAED